MNADPHEQHVTDNSDDEMQYFDQLANKGKEKVPPTLTKTERKQKRREERQQAKEAKKLARRHARGSKEAEMGLDDEEDGGMHRPIEVDDDSDEDSIEIVDNPGPSNAAQTVHYQDTLPTDRASRGTKRSKKDQEDGEIVTGRTSHEDRKKYWAAKGPKEPASPPAKREKVSRKPQKGEHHRDEQRHIEQYEDKEEDFSNLHAAAGDAIEQNADFVSFF
jgi:hypothetical protein